jgi:hypothetical protein
MAKLDVVLMVSFMRLTPLFRNPDLIDLRSFFIKCTTYILQISKMRIPEFWPRLLFKDPLSSREALIYYNEVFKKGIL